MKKLIFSGALVLSLGLAACSEEAEKPIPKDQTIEKPTQKVSAEMKWQDEITKLASNSDSASDKFYALEKLLMDYKATEAEVKEFSTYIIDDYKSGNYLSDIGNHERMLSNIFKSYYVEKNSEGALKDFAFDYFQNMKYTYRGADTVDSEAVKSNEEQMNKALKEIK
ncbi:hypothetical protein PVA17_04935 [Lysinibacillus sp. CNPSo 3705]|uniref:hypothetical protein n=1 Tax=Lysinibacillus sp. CNPSo 3705 TaxID=3028148 RepID=UPI0023643FBC|nr:hypothetical protein [Lysinibacillus sp. CNPSo 3705]MDD1502114.1 hypothetical protein [Lysinibacillus sp. CNPSo 3705]